MCCELGRASGGCCSIFDLAMTDIDRTTSLGADKALLGTVILYATLAEYTLFCLTVF